MQNDAAGPVIVPQCSVPKVDGERFHLRANGRYVSLVRAQGKLYCIDSICFHAGGPLALGDIEELEGHQCLVCPWHYYKVALDTGEKWYQGIERSEHGDKMIPGPWKRHILLQTDGQLASDNYACKHECGERVIHGHAKNAIPGYKCPESGLEGHGFTQPSGHVLKGPPPVNTRPLSKPQPGSGEGEDVWPEDLTPVASPLSRRKSSGSAEGSPVPFRKPTTHNT
jgi:nitrite reductase/ring-hydroxylating ferredoxin subunit